ncbi:MAG: HlyD family efflux transporter periplasmic adaptor subunit [Planctomycetales bacterium]|nr:HlyD family efflux transporter periplasmic adaptor subunit [Planctomycetales bacterium]
MNAAVDPNAWLQARWNLRPDVQVMTRPDRRGGATYVLEDRLQGKFYEVGAAEHRFIAQLNGRRTVAEALDAVNRRNGEASAEPFNLSQAQQVVQWLASAQLTQLTGGSQGERLHRLRESQRRRETLQRLNPLAAKLPLGNPDRLLRAVAPRLGWLKSPWTLAFTVCVAMVAAWRVGEQLPRLSASAAGVFSPDRWLWMALCWLALKVMHEFAHGIICRLYGGNVREAGVMLLYFFPVAYVDVTSAWRFRSAWQRIHTSAAGMQMELFVASLAALVWSWTRPGVLNDICFYAMVSASVTTVLFNANPLMRFDGYYMLSDLLGIPNLYSGALQHLTIEAKRTVLGLSVRGTRPIGPAWLLLSYGMAIVVWRLFVVAGIVLMLSQLFYGAGLVLAAFVVMSSLVVPVRRLWRYLHDTEEVTPMARRRFVVSASVAVAATGLLLLTPISPRHVAPGIVEYSPLTMVRSPAAGFVEAVLVEDGQWVEAGQPLVSLVNRELQLQLQQRRTAVLEAEVEARRLQQAGDHAGCQAALRRLDSAREQWREVKQRCDGQSILAPVSGRVLRRNLANLAGRHFQEGAELLAIGDDAAKELRVSIDQGQLEGLQRLQRASVRVRIPGHRPFRALLQSVEPQASVKPLHLSLCATAGGVLPVVIENDEVRLVEPRFTAVAKLPAELASELQAGRRATAVLELARRPLLHFVHSRLKQWLDARM